MAIEFGVVDHLDRQNVPVHETYDGRLKLMELFDQAGFSTFHITEHHFTPLGLAPSPLSFCPPPRASQSQFVWRRWS